MVWDYVEHRWCDDVLTLSFLPIQSMNTKQHYNLNTHAYEQTRANLRYGQGMDVR